MLPERTQLAANLCREVLHSRHIALHRIELAKRLLFAAAMLENARGLLDEIPTLFGGSAKNSIELSLTHNDVHLAAKARIREEILDIEQTAGRAIDRVLGAAGTEQGATDRHFRVLDRECAIRVVDRESDLRAAQRWTPGCPRKDDVGHIAAAQGLGALLTHHPGERINDV